jgi:DNA-binding cell septation regulator SpoVG
MELWMSEFSQRRPPTPAELEASWGIEPKPPLKIRRWQPYRNAAGTLLGYLDVELPSGMVINGCKLMIGSSGKRWVAMPSERHLDRDGKPRLSPDGKPLWSPIVEFVDKATRDSFCAQTLAALQRDHPNAFDLGDER